MTTLTLIIFLIMAVMIWAITGIKERIESTRIDIAGSALRV
jgi:hypothetical protein